ncbi:hypothetical protein MKX07_003196 [Trichoderma sp. CBMAI-0711]|nr:hypothetical protein MKX07_003196 [Trichoderma sp. CBMAI-0711]
MDPIDPTTGQPLPSDAIQRILFVATPVHVYNIPPLTSMRGHSASSWTEDPARHIFTARLRVVETSFESTSSSSLTDASSSSTSIKIDLVLEDPSTGALFAAAPYLDPSAVEPVVDSSRFFAVTVKDPQGRKAVLGIGFEERSEAFDLAVSLQEARRSLGWESEQAHGGSGSGNNNSADAKAKKTETKDYSLKEGETITVNLGGTKFGRRRPHNAEDSSTSSSSSADLQSFALPPPPAGGFSLPPPPKTSDVKEKRRSLKNLGFDDGQFGEFA